MTFGNRDAQPLGGFFEQGQSALADLIKQTRANELPAMAQAQVEQTKRIREIAARKFGDAEGEELLEALCDATLRRPTFITQSGMPSDQVLALGQFREGMGATVFLLLGWIAEGRNEQPPQREGHHAKSTRKPKSRARPRKRA